MGDAADSVMSVIDAGLALLKRTVIDNPFIPNKPHVLLECKAHGTRSANLKLRYTNHFDETCGCDDLQYRSPQATFLGLTCKEAFYGGAAGGGKSEALLMSALQFVQVPGYSALILRKEYPRLFGANGLIPRSHTWLSSTGAEFIGTPFPRWVFPSGAQLSFGHLRTANDRYRYQGHEYQFIGFDELTEFEENDYRYVTSRLRGARGTSLEHIPERVRGTGNPGGTGHAWVKRRFIDPHKDRDRVFVPASLKDNPSLDPKRYAHTLSRLDPLTRKRLLDGDWNVKLTGGIFKRSWVKVVPVGEVPKDVQWVRFWDLASTRALPGTDPDWTAGALVGSSRGRVYVGNVRRLRGTPLEVEEFVLETARSDGTRVPIVMEKEPGASGVMMIDHYTREVLTGYDFRPQNPLGKPGSWMPVASLAEAGFLYLVEGPWVEEFLDEMEGVRYDMRHAHDDQMDAVAGGFHRVTGTHTLGASWVPEGDDEGRGGGFLGFTGHEPGLDPEDIDDGPGRGSTGFGFS